MKSIQSKNITPNNSNHSPFFKKGNSDFFPVKNKPFFNTLPIQAKLTVNEPNDPYEKEADSMANKVVQRLNDKSFSGSENNPPHFFNKPRSFVQRKCASCEQEEKLQKKEEDNEKDVLKNKLQTKPIFESNAEPAPDDEKNIQRKCAECEKEEKLQKKSDSMPQAASSSIERNLNSSKGFGSQLPQNTRQQMESSFGTDFSGVRIHDDTSSVQMNKDLHAQAFTHGSDIYFNEGKYNTNSNSGKHLLAHELTHVLQQGKAVAAKIQKLGDLSRVPPMACEVANTSSAGTLGVSSLFSTSSASLSVTQRNDIAIFVTSWRASGGTDVLRVDGYASTSGADEMNWQLSCDRALSVANELRNNGVPDSFITIFAQGETIEFGSQGNNQRADITILARPTTPPAPAVPLKTITVDFVRLHGSTLSPATELASANTIFGACSINFVTGAMPPQETLVITQAWLGGDTDVNASGITCAGTTSEEKKMYDQATAAHGLSSRMRVFLVHTFSGYGAAGFSRPPYCAGGGYANHVILANIASGATNPLAHEFGHILQNNGVHSVSPNLMAPSGGTLLNPTQCATCYANA